MDILYAPWRGEYVTKTARTRPTAMTSDECIFCAQFQEHNDEKYYFLKRYQHTVVMLNRHPYNAGHLMILPFEHIANLYDLSSETRNEIMALTSYSSHVL